MKRFLGSVSIHCVGKPKAVQPMCQQSSCHTPEIQKGYFETNADNLKLAFSIGIQTSFQTN